QNCGAKAGLMGLAILMMSVTAASIAQPLLSSSPSSAAAQSTAAAATSITSKSLITSTTSAAQSMVSSQAAVSQQIVEEDRQALFAAIEARARTLASENYRTPAVDMPRELADMTYEQYRSINFRPEAALWRNESLFEIQLFHPGFLYKEPVVLHMASPGGDAALQFKPEYFTYVGQAEPIAGKAPATLGFAGFRVRS